MVVPHRSLLSFFLIFPALLLAIPALNAQQYCYQFVGHEQHYKTGDNAPNVSATVSVNIDSLPLPKSVSATPYSTDYEFSIASQVNTITLILGSSSTVFSLQQIVLGQTTTPIPSSGMTILGGISETGLDKKPRITKFIFIQLMGVKELFPSQNLPSALPPISGKYMARIIQWGGTDNTAEKHILEIDSIGGCASQIKSITLISRPLDSWPPFEDPWQIKPRLARHTYFLVTDFTGTNTTYAGFSVSGFLHGIKNNGSDLTSGDQPIQGVGCGNQTLLGAVCQQIHPSPNMTLDDIAKFLEEDAKHYGPEGKYDYFHNNCNVWASKRIAKLKLNIKLPEGAFTSNDEACGYLPVVVGELNKTGIMDDPVAKQLATTLILTFIGGAGCQK